MLLYIWGEVVGLFVDPLSSVVALVVGAVGVDD